LLLQFVVVNKMLGKKVGAPYLKKDCEIRVMDDAHLIGFSIANRNGGSGDKVAGHVDVRVLNVGEEPLSKAILLDWDGVLCDSLVLYFELYQESFRRHHKDFPIHTIEEFRSWYNPRWEKNYYDLGFSESEFQEVLAFSHSYLQYSKAALFDTIPETLTRWADVYPLAIVSTTPSPVIRDRLADSGLDHLFRCYTGGEDGCSSKRDKVAQTLLTLGASQAVMVGDTPLDIDAGQYNQIQTVGVTYGWVTPDRIYQSKPDRIVDSPSQLFQTVLDLLQ
jgi:phosphoglycolate phosphatase-like HAD superfamily hydrolase